MRLATATLARLDPAVLRPAYDRQAQAVGIVHFGIGAFHRAHQAVFLDDAMNAGETGWAVTGVSLRSPSVADQLNPQDGLYTLAVRDAQSISYRLIGSVRRVLVATREQEAVVAAVAAPQTRILTFTITEKGYCRTPSGGLDLALAGPGSVYPLLAQGLARRRSAGLGGLTLLSCDNLAANGAQLRSLLRAYLEAVDPSLSAWVEDACTFPSAMVDRIVPATTEADRRLCEARAGLRDEAHVGTEPFRQWVVEDNFAAGRPNLERYGVTLVEDVSPFESAKLRMLNAAHSAMAYLGLARGHAFVHQAVADPYIADLVGRLMQQEAAASISPAPGQDLDLYAQELLARFANPALQHRLSQIAMDGSQKIPQRWLETLAWNQARGLSCPAILAGVAAWLIHLRAAGGAVEDPMAAKLAMACDRGEVADLVDAILGPVGLIPSGWTPSAADKARIGEVMRNLGAQP